MCGDVADTPYTYVWNQGEKVLTENDGIFHLCESCQKELMDFMHSK